MKFFLAFVALFVAASAQDQLSSFQGKLKKKKKYQKSTLSNEIIVYLEYMTSKFSIFWKCDNQCYHPQDECTLCKMGVDALGKYLNTPAEIAAVEEGKNTIILHC